MNNTKTAPAPGIKTGIAGEERQESTYPAVPAPGFFYWTNDNTTQYQVTFQLQWAGTNGANNEIDITATLAPGPNSDIPTFTPVSQVLDVSIFNPAQPGLNLSVQTPFGTVLNVFGTLTWMNYDNPTQSPLIAFSGSIVEPGVRNCLPNNILISYIPLPLS